MIENDILTLLATIAAVTIATVGVITFIYERRKFRLAALVETYRFLGDIRHRWNGIRQHNREERD